MSNFHPLEVVDRVSETHLEVDEHFYEITWRAGLTNFDLHF